MFSWLVKLQSFTNQENIFSNCFFANVSDFVLCPRVTFFPFFYKRAVPYNKKLTDLNRSDSVRENIQPRSCCIDLAISRSIQQDLGWIFSRTRPVSY